MLIAFSWYKWHGCQRYLFYQRDLTCIIACASPCQISSWNIGVDHVLLDGNLYDHLGISEELNRWKETVLQNLLLLLLLLLLHRKTLQCSYLYLSLHVLLLPLSSWTFEPKFLAAPLIILDILYRYPKHINTISFHQVQFKPTSCCNSVQLSSSQNIQSKY